MKQAGFVFVPRYGTRYGIFVATLNISYRGTYRTAPVPRYGKRYVTLTLSKIKKVTCNRENRFYCCAACFYCDIVLCHASQTGNFVEYCINPEEILLLTTKSIKERLNVWPSNYPTNFKEFNCQNVIGLVDGLILNKRSGKVNAISSSFALLPTWGNKHLFSHNYFQNSPTRHSARF